MNKKYIIESDGMGNLIDKNGSMICSESTFILDEYEEKQSIDLPALIAQGMTSDDLIKLKSNGVI